MKILLIISILFCLQDSVKTDTVKVQKPVKLFFAQNTVIQKAENINAKLDSLIVILQKNDSINLK